MAGDKSTLIQTKKLPKEKMDLLDVLGLRLDPCPKPGRYSQSVLCFFSSNASSLLIWLLKDWFISEDKSSLTFFMVAWNVLPNA